MANLAEMFEEKADGPILAVVIGDDESKQFAVAKNDPRWRDRKKHPLHGKVVSWNEARPILDYEFEDSKCHAVYAWTANSVLCVLSMDDDYYTGVCRLPRNTTPCEPSFNGD